MPTNRAQRAEPLPDDESAVESPASGTGTEGGGRRRGGRKRSRSSKKRRTKSASGDEASVAVADEPSEPGEGARSKGRRRRRRKSASEGADGSEAAAAAGDEAGDEEKGTRPARKRSRRRKKATSESEVEVAAPRGEGAASEGDEDDESGTRRRRRRGSRGGRRRKKGAGAPEPVAIDAIPGEEDELPEPPSVEEEPDAEKKTKRKKRERKKKVAEVPEEQRDQVILVNSSDPRETRVAVVEDGRIIDFQMTVDSHHSLVNDIYRGRVVNLEEAIGAAFVDFGQGRNGFLHASDVMAAYGDKDWKLEKLLTTRVDDGAWSEEAADDDDEPKEKDKKGRRGGARRRGRPRLPIGDLLRKGQMAVVQITKDAIGDKGPTLTTYISIPGRYLVLMPSLSRTGVSRKIEDEKERRRLKRILSGLDIPEGMGVIVRTAGIGKTKTELKRDLDYLLAVWETFSRRLVSGRNPMPLYQESDVAIRTMRDLFSSRTESVIVDDEHLHQRMVDFTKKLMPEHEDRIVLHEGARPLLHSHGVEQDFERIFAKRVELPSGGSIVFDQTEALVAIDVNSGRTREEGADFEDIALKTNLEAAPEIARQIRLRDLGGIIVLDFIDMMRMASRRQVEKAFREALSTDRARSKVGRISQFGLLELTRQRLGPGLSKLLFENCWRCRGTGSLRTPHSRGHAIIRRLGSALTQKGFSTVEVRAHPDVIELLQHDFQEALDDLKAGSNRELRFTAVPDQVEDSVLRYLRADGREVRPGGRRKR